MKVCVIGTGRMGKGLAKTLSPYVDVLYWASRDPKRVESSLLECKFQNIIPISYGEALETDILFHTLWFKDVIPWAKENKEKLSSKIVVDITNPFTVDFTDFTLAWGTSAAEELQKVIPDAIVVGAFKNTFFQVFDQPIHNGLQSDVYVTSDDEKAKEKVMSFLQPIPFRILDGGKLSNNRTIERMTLFERELAIRYGTYPYVSNRMFGI